jgi:hypothetical protein
VSRYTAKSSQKCGVRIAAATVQVRVGCSAGCGRVPGPASAAAGSRFGKARTIGITAAAIAAARARYERRQPIEEIRSWATGADVARPKPLADCTIEIASPRRCTNQRERIGTETTRPRQFDPSVITRP